jgi:formate dehydrogenase subunit delta
MDTEKLAYMANQIGRFFAAHKPETRVPGIEDHIRKFWDPRMRREFLANLDGLTLDPSVRAAAERIRDNP